MRPRERWKQSSGTAKIVVALALLFVLQIGLCALTPTALSWRQAMLNRPQSDDPFESWGLMFFQAVFCFITFVALIAVWLRPRGHSDD
jgi:hypothetical protein